MLQELAVIRWNAFADATTDVEMANDKTSPTRQANYLPLQENSPPPRRISRQSRGYALTRRQQFTVTGDDAITVEPSRGRYEPIRGITGGFPG